MAEKMKHSGCLPGPEGDGSGLTEDQAFRESPDQYWHFATLSQVPAYRDSPFADSKYDGLRDLLITGASVEGKPAAFFAYVGYPATPPPAGGYPGILLIHGGGGTAYPQYMNLWMDQGYVVMALDWYNQRPLSQPGRLTETNVARAALPGGKRQLHEINVANMVIAHSLLRSLDQVNADKTAFVGLSWGSWYGAIVAAVDPRFKGGIEIYCGGVDKNRPDMINGRFHHAIKVPLYWVASTNDQNVTPAALQHGFNACAKLENKSLVIDLPHSHIGFPCPSCFRMAAFFLQDGPGLPKLGSAQLSGSVLRADIIARGKGVTQAILCYTEDAKEPIAYKRTWKSIPAQVSADQVQAELPPNVFQCFLSAYDEKSPFDDLCGSTNLLEFPVYG